MPGTWTLYDVMAVDDELRPAPIEQASVASERRDRVASSRSQSAESALGDPATACLVIIGAVATYLLARPELASVPDPAPWHGSPSRVRRAGHDRLGAHGDRVGEADSGSRISRAKSAGSIR